MTGMGNTCYLWARLGSHRARIAARTVLKPWDRNSGSDRASVIHTGLRSIWAHGQCLVNVIFVLLTIVSHYLLSASRGWKSDATVYSFGKAVTNTLSNECHLPLAL